MFIANFWDIFLSPVTLLILEKGVSVDCVFVPEEKQSHLLLVDSHLKFDRIISRSFHKII